MFELGMLVTVIVAVSQLGKQFNYIPAKFIPLFNMALGLIAGIFYLQGDLKENILYGLVIGLTASGVFDMTKVVKK